MHRCNGPIAIRPGFECKRLLIATISKQPSNRRNFTAALHTRPRLPSGHRRGGRRPRKDDYEKAPHLCGAGPLRRRIYLPVPSINEVWGLLLALSYTNKAVSYDSAASGVNVTLMVHLPLAARLVVQVVAETA